MTSLLLLLSIASASEVHVVRPGDSVGSVAAWMGDPKLAKEIRQLNEISSGDKPVPGDVWVLPTLQGAYAKQAAYAVQVHGDAEITDPVKVPIARFDRAMPSNRLCTEDGAALTLRLAVGVGSPIHDDLDVYERTCLTIENLASRPLLRSSHLTLERGEVSVRSVKDKDGTVSIATPLGMVLGVQGGFRIQLGEELRVQAILGPVELIVDGVETHVDAGKGIAVTGEGIGEAVDLTPPPELTRPGVQEVLNRPNFAWTAVEGAEGYRVEIAAGPDFERLVKIIEVTETSWIPQEMTLPFRENTLWWRVTAHGADGHQGIPAEPRQLVLPGQLTEPEGPEPAE